MTTPAPPNWIERLRRLHPLLKDRPTAWDWAARQAEIDAASKVDATTARRAREDAARRKDRDYDDESATWVGIAVVVVIAILGLFVAFRLIEESQLEDCLLAHRHNCESLLDR